MSEIVSGHRVISSASILQLSLLPCFLGANFILTPFIFTDIGPFFKFGDWTASALFSLPNIVGSVLMYGSPLLGINMSSATSHLRLVVSLIMLSAITFICSIAITSAAAFIFGFMTLRIALILLGNFNRQVHSSTNGISAATTAFSISVILSNVSSSAFPLIGSFLVSKLSVAFLVAGSALLLGGYVIVTSIGLLMGPRLFNGVVVPDKALLFGSAQRMSKSVSLYFATFSVTVLQFQIFSMMPMIIRVQSPEASSLIGIYYTMVAVTGVVAAASAPLLVGDVSRIGAARAFSLAGVAAGMGLILPLLDPGIPVLALSALLMGISQGLFLPSLLSLLQGVENSETRAAVITDVTFLTSILGPSIAPYFGLTLVKLPIISSLPILTVFILPSLIRPGIRAHNTPSSLSGARLS